MISLLLGFVVVLLPARFRRRWFSQWQGNLRVTAGASGVAQMLLAVGLLIAGYMPFVRSQMQQIYSMQVISEMAEKGGDTAVRGMGIIFLLAYLFLPTTLVLIYFTFEGVVRVAAATATGEVVGTLPLLVVDAAVQKWKEYYAEKKQGPRVPDLVAPAVVEGSGYDVAVASCRCKPGWDHLVTISYHDVLYEVADYVEGDAPRNHVYLLRRAPLNKVVRGLQHYDPEEVMGK